MKPITPRCFTITSSVCNGWRHWFARVDDAMTYRYREKKSFIASVFLERYGFTGRELRALAAREFPILTRCARPSGFTRMALKPYLAANRSRDVSCLVSFSTGVRAVSAMRQRGLLVSRLGGQPVKSG